MTERPEAELKGAIHQVLGRQQLLRVHPSKPDCARGTGCPIPLLGHEEEEKLG